MVLSEAQRRDAYREAQQILRLNEKWQELMPGERKPNFERAAQEILRRALGHKVRRNEEPLNIHGGLAHEHGPREARLIERYLRSGTVHPDVLHSFQHDVVTRDPNPVVAQPDVALHPDDPDIEVYIHDHSETIDYPSHYEVGTGTYHSSVVAPPPFAKELVSKVPQEARLPNDYVAVH